MTVKELTVLAISRGDEVLLGSEKNLWAEDVRYMTTKAPH